MWRRSPTTHATNSLPTAPLAVGWLRPSPDAGPWLLGRLAGLIKACETLSKTSQIVFRAPHGDECQGLLTPHAREDDGTNAGPAMSPAKHRDARAVVFEGKPAACCTGLGRIVEWVVGTFRRQPRQAP